MGRTGRSWRLALAVTLYAALAAWVLPAIQLSGEAHRRAKCVDNLKQITLAMCKYEYEGGNGHLPGNIVDKDGKPLLSWRVAILPFMDEDEKALYDEFKLDEPWDSPHNKPLLEKMPTCYHCPSRRWQSDSTLTNYLGFEGPRTVFEKGGKVRFNTVTDDLSSTLALVEAQEGAPWTKPADLPFDENAPPSLYGAGSPHTTGFNAAFLDGSVRFIGAFINPAVFKALITRNGGEAIDRGVY